MTTARLTKNDIKMTADELIDLTPEALQELWKKCKATNSIVTVKDTDLKEFKELVLGEIEVRDEETKKAQEKAKSKKLAPKKPVQKPSQKPTQKPETKSEPTKTAKADKAPKPVKLPAQVKDGAMYEYISYVKGMNDIQRIVGEIIKVKKDGTILCEEMTAGDKPVSLAPINWELMEDGGNIYFHSPSLKTVSMITFIK